MPASAIAAATRYFQPGVTKVVLIPSIATFASGPLRAEIDAGTDVSRDIAAISGWSIASERVDTPDLGTRFVSNVQGRLRAADSGLTFYASLDGADIRDELELDQALYVAFMDGGDVAARLMDVFQVTVSGMPKMRDLEDAPRIDVTFNIRAYVENLAIPAHA